MPKKKTKKSLTKKSFRRNFLFALSGFLLVLFLFSPFAKINPIWYEPPVIESKNGVLDATLIVKKALVDIGGKKVESVVYNGQYPGPTFKIKPGDSFRVNVVNQAAQNTNLHFHGSHVSPKENGDNVFIDIKPGEEFQYEYNVPTNHSPGLYWYHPHWHSTSEEQVLDGMAGAIEMTGGLDELPGIKDVPVRRLVLSTVDGKNQNTPIRLVNGKKNPILYMQPGQTYRLEVFNISADDFYNFSIPGMTLYMISQDGNPMAKVMDKDSMLLSPGNRVQMLIKAGMPGLYEVKSLAFDQGFAKYVDDTFMTIKVQGLPVVPHPLPTTLIPHVDLRTATIDKVRTLTFSMGKDKENPTFLLDGKMFDMNRVDQVITLGTTEEWHLINEGNEWHPFHIHINPFQVISVNGQPVEDQAYWDTFAIPPHGEVIMRTRYTDFDGKFVLHCHILFHEDHGMMQVVQIVDPNNPSASEQNSAMDSIYMDSMHQHMVAPRPISERGKRVEKNHEM